MSDDNTKLEEGKVKIDKNLMNSESVTVKIPKDPTRLKSEERREVLELLGLSKKEEEYKVKTKTENEDLGKVVEAIKKESFKSGILPDQADSIIKTAVDQFESINKSLKDNKEAKSKKVVENLKESWGEKYSEKRESIKRYVSGLDEDLKKSFEASGALEDEGVLKLLDKLAAGQDEEDRPLDGGGKSDKVFATLSELEEQASELAKSKAFKNRVGSDYETAKKKYNAIMERIADLKLQGTKDGESFF